MSLGTVFSNYELRKMSVKPVGVDAAITANCVGSIEEEMETKVVTKSCRGVVVKTRVRGTGAGTLTISMHVPVAMYRAIYALKRDDLADGVMGYGNANVHPEFQITADVYDEDDNEKLVAYPRCIMQTGPNSSIENGAEEVAEVELEISVMPDDNGYGKYEAFADELSEDIKSKWMENFTSELVLKATT